MLAEYFIEKVANSEEYADAMLEIAKKIHKLFYTDFYCKDYLNEKWSSKTQKIIDYYKKAKQIIFTKKQNESTLDM